MPNSGSTYDEGFLTPAKKRVVALVAAVVLALLVVAVQPAPREAYAASDLLPDLEMLSLQDVHIEKTTSGRRQLRFTAIIVNHGSGPLELHGERPDTSTPAMAVSQRIFDDAGGYRDVPTQATMHWGADGRQDRWRVKRLQSFVLKRPNSGRRVAVSPKEYFCLHEGVYRYGSTKPPYYTYNNVNACGSSASDLQVLMGLSVGWGDRYLYSLPYMYINIPKNRVPPGDYRLEATADPSNWYMEEDDTNNRTWVDLRLLKGGGVQILGYGPNAQ